MRLSTRLISLLLVTNLAAIFWSGWQLYDNVNHELEEVLSAKLKTTSLTLLAVADDLDMLDEASLGNAFASYVAVDNGWLRQFWGGAYHEEKSSMSQVPDDFLVSVELYDSDGTRIYTVGGQDFQFSFTGDSGFNTVADGEYQWLVHGRKDPASRLTVYVAHREDLRRYVSSEVVSDFVFEFSVLLPLIVLAIGLSVYLGLRPLVQLSSDIKQRKAHHLEPLALPGKPTREVSAIVTALNSLFSRLKNSFDRERRFTADAAHELRTPLAIIKAQADLLGTADSLDEARQLGKELMLSTDRLSDLLDQLLMLARTEAETQTLEMQVVELNELLTDVVSSCVLAADDDLEIVFDAQSSETIRCYPPLAMQLFSNLIRNAEKYAPPQAEITLTVSERDDDQICVSVADQGCGVPEQDLERIFQRFYRAEQTRDQVGGAGLGLSIVQAIVKRHGWEIEAQNIEQGGLKVSVILPREKV